MNAKDYNRIRNEILQLMTPPERFRMKKPPLSLLVLYLITGFILMFTGIQIGQLKAGDNALTASHPETLHMVPELQPVSYQIGSGALPENRFPELPDIEVVLREI